MVAFFFLLSIFLIGILLTRAFSFLPSLTRIAGSWVVGSIVCITFIYYASSLLKSLDNGLLLYSVVALCILFFKRKIIGNEIKKIKLTSFEALLLFVLFCFSYYLCNKTFSYNNGTFLIASNIYLDFGAHIPFIRSFSMGNNFPGEVPFFAHSGLLYYFLFDCFAGIVEHIGWPIHLALNSISAISFTLLCTTIYQLSLLLFKKRFIGIVSILLFLFSSNLSFITFITTHGLRFSTIFALWHNNFYLEGTAAPLIHTIVVSGFWNLNPYTNQRHLMFGALVVVFFVCLLIFYIQKKRIPNKKEIILLGIVMGLFPLWHVMMFLSLCFLLGGFFLLFPNFRKSIFSICCIGSFFALPQLLVIKHVSANTILFNPGFLLSENLTIFNFILFWISNLGISLFLMIAAWIVVGKTFKKYFLIFCLLFIIPNIFQFSSRFHFDDHKYFNLWIIFMNIFCAYILYILFQKGLAGKIACLALLFLATASGIISFFVIKNDVHTHITDYPKNIFLQHVLTDIPPSQITLTNGEIYDPITLIGRKTFLGRIQYIYVYGGNANSRLEDEHTILQGSNPQNVSYLLRKNHIAFVALYKNSFAKNATLYKRQYFDTYSKKVYEDSFGIIYKI